VHSLVIPGVELEILSWVMLLSAPRPAKGETVLPTTGPHARKSARTRAAFEPETGEFSEVAVHERGYLRPGAVIHGPAVIVEDETSTVVNQMFDARADAFG
jgi:N-methylhydantoinase A